MGQRLALIFLKRRVRSDVQVWEDEERAVSAKDRSGNAGRARTHSFPKDGCRCLRWQFDGMNLFGSPAMGNGGLSSRRAEIAHPVHDPVRGDQVAFPFLDKNHERRFDRLTTFPSANREQ